MHSVAYEIFYSTDNQAGRALLNDEDIARALKDFPSYCDHCLPEGSSISVASGVKDSHSIVIFIHSPADAEIIREIVKQCADGLRLYGRRLESVPPITLLR